MLIEMEKRKTIDNYVMTLAYNIEKKINIYFRFLMK